jgi:spore maturation protein CgeB
VKAAYIGILTEGSTSKMRADTLRSLLPAADWDFIDTDIGFQRAGRLSKTVSFRWKTGPLVTESNRKIVEHTSGSSYDLVWVDKGVYVWPETTRFLRKRSARLVHFTPDTAFHANRSRHFFRSAPEYDLLVTTKSFELESYAGIVVSANVMLTTQAYDADTHRLSAESSHKYPGTVFIGLCESDREKCIEALIAAGVTVRVGGQGWGRFARRHAGNPNFHFLGPKVFGAQYVSEYGRASVGLGLLSKKFPELHTTRTFEIPACGTMLATERTSDTVSFFDEDEALFFDNYAELAQKVCGLLSDPKKIEAISRNGHHRVLADGRDYASVLSGVLRRLAVNS